MGKALEKITAAGVLSDSTGLDWSAFATTSLGGKYGHSDTLAPATGGRPGES